MKIGSVVIAFSIYGGQKRKEDALLSNNRCKEHFDKKEEELEQ